MSEDLINDILFRLSIGNNLPDIARELGFDIHDFYALFADDKRLRESYGNCVTIGHPLQMERMRKGWTTLLAKMKSDIPRIEEAIDATKDPIGKNNLRAKMAFFRQEISELEDKL